MRSKRQTAHLVLALLCLALLVGSAYPLATEDIEVIWTIPGNTALRAFGASIASGDVNGDGVPDIMVASDTTGDVDIFRGEVSIYYGNHVGDSAPDLILRSPVCVGSNLPVLACGDLNGDGYADLAMGEDMADDGIGICTIFMGGDQMNTTTRHIIYGRSCWWLNAAFGYDVSIGDVNGDGYNDLAVGAYYSAHQPGEYGRGRVYVFYGGPGFDTIPDVTLKGGHDGESEGFGIGVSAEGDFDHDGFHDLYIGAWQYGGFGGSGRMYVYYGGSSMDTSYDMAMTGEGPAQCLGYEKPGALNAQGDFDFAVEGNELWPHGIFDPAANCGKVYVHHGGRPMDSIPDVPIVGRMDGANLGYSAQSAGDASGNGNDDLVAGAPYLPPIGTGAAYLWETGNHFDTVPDAWMTGEAPEQLVGERVRTAGDLDGDGRSEFMVSNYSSDSAKRVWVCKYTGVGLQEEEAVRVRNGTSLRVYPNPCREQVFLSCPATTSENPTLRICDVSGRVVRTLMLERAGSTAASPTATWDLRDDVGRPVEQGVYVVELERKSGTKNRHCSAKVIVERQ
jgi:hypothetical protein